jgi:TonB family protein
MAKHVKAGGHRFSFNDLRSVSADGAATAEEAQAILGDASAQTTKRDYSRGLTRAKPREVGAMISGTTKIACVSLCGTLIVACASQPPAAPPAPPMSSAPPAASGGSVRTIPHGTYSHRMMLEGGRDWYPPEARRRTLTGRVVVEFRIDAAGKPEDVRINRAEADRILQIAAVYMVTTFSSTQKILC